MIEKLPKEWEDHNIANLGALARKINEIVDKLTPEKPHYLICPHCGSDRWSRGSTSTLMGGSTNYHTYSCFKCGKTTKVKRVKMGYSEGVSVTLGLKGIKMIEKLPKHFDHPKITAKINEIIDHLNKAHEEGYHIPFGGAFLVTDEMKHIMNSGGCNIDLFCHDCEQEDAYFRAVDKKRTVTCEQCPYKEARLKQGKKLLT
jgi:Zn finger protein HypA/HybF involved in hydrogenase expression